jgi:hypothetical protein
MCLSNRRTDTKTAAIRAAVQLHMFQLGRLPCQKTQGSRRNTTTVKRQRRPVRDIYKELGKTYFRRAYRMNYATFCKLYRLLAPRFKILRADKKHIITYLMAEYTPVLFLPVQFVYLQVVLLMILPLPMV